MLQVEVRAAIWVCLKTEDNTNLTIDDLSASHWFSHLFSYIVIIFHQITSMATCLNWARGGKDDCDGLPGLVLCRLAPQKRQYQRVSDGILIFEDFEFVWETQFHKPTVPFGIVSTTHF